MDITYDKKSKTIKKTCFKCDTDKKVFNEILKDKIVESNDQILKSRVTSALYDNTLPKANVECINKCGKKNIVYFTNEEMNNIYVCKNCNIYWMGINSST
jgi:DNA-directed RNA polymerase subunit M/transcription elongation factor TFIIS